MHIGLVGGLDRNEALYAEIAARSGHSLEWHTGDMAGRGTQTLESLVERCAVIIVVTDVNSHAAVWRVRRLSKLRGRRCLLMNRCGVSRFVGITKQLQDEERTLACVANK